MYMFGGSATISDRTRFSCRGIIWTKVFLNRAQLHPRYPILQIVPRGTFLKSIYVLHQYLDLYRCFFYKFYLLIVTVDKLKISPLTIILPHTHIYFYTFNLNRSVFFKSSK